MLVYTKSFYHFMLNIITVLRMKTTHNALTNVSKLNNILHYLHLMLHLTSVMVIDDFNSIHILLF